MLKHLFSFFYRKQLKQSPTLKTEVPQQEKSFNLNHEIVGLIENHGFQTNVHEGVIVPVFKEKVNIKSEIIFRKYDGFINTRLDISVHLANGKCIVESFGDTGQNEEKAKENSLTNFIHNDFHVLLNAFNDIDDETILIEDWDISGLKYKAFIGNYCFKSECDLPPEIFKQIKTIVQQQKFGDDYHWIRFYYANLNNAPIAVEFMIDNLENQTAADQMTTLNWERKEDFYSVRNFILFKRIS